MKTLADTHCIFFLNYASGHICFMWTLANIYGHRLFRLFCGQFMKEKYRGETSNIHLKATVVQDLYKILDTHSIAGIKLSEKFLGLPFQLSNEPTEEALLSIPPRRN